MKTWLFIGDVDDHKHHDVAGVVGLKKKACKAVHMDEELLMAADDDGDHDNHHHHRCR